MEILLHARKSFRRERLSMVDVLLLNDLDKLIFIFIIIFTYISKQATLMRRSTVLSLPFNLYSLLLSMWNGNNS